GAAAAPRLAGRARAGGAKAGARVIGSVVCAGSFLPPQAPQVARQHKTKANRRTSILYYGIARPASARPNSPSIPAPVYLEDIARALDRYDGQEVTLRGWLYNKRSSKKVHFLEVRDGTGILQCVAGIADVPAELFARTDKLAQETALVVTGKVRRDA